MHTQLHVEIPGDGLCFSLILKFGTKACTCFHGMVKYPTFVDDFDCYFEAGERLSPWVAVGCFTMGVSIIFF